MDGEQILAYASLANMAGIAIVARLVWTGRKGREEGVRASDIEDVKRTLHVLNNVVAGLPNRESLKLLAAELRVEIKVAELAAAAAAVAAAAARMQP